MAIDEKQDLQQVERVTTRGGKVDQNITAEAMDAEKQEHQMTIMEAIKAYPMACFWAFVMSFHIIMESFDMFLVSRRRLRRTVIARLGGQIKSAVEAD